jgi:5,10-methylenetetrahydromethanopterin reductase
LKKVAIGFNADLSVQEIVDYAVQAELAGFESFWLHEHSFSRDALSYLSTAAAKTRLLRLGVACLSPYTRHPVVLAMSMLTLQESSNGRAVLGLGTGFPMRLDLMSILHEKPIAALKEAIEICRKIWAGESVNYSGKVFSVKNTKSLPGKARSSIPVYIAGWKPQMLALSGKYADGYVAKGGESPQSLGRIVSEIKSAAEKNSRRMSDIEVCAYLLTLVGRTKQEAIDRARKDPFVTYMLSVQDDYLLEETGINSELKRPIAQNYFKGNVAEASSHVKDSMIEAFTLCGTETEICERVLDYEKVGLDLPILQPISMRSDDIRNILNTGNMLISDGFNDRISRP